MGSSGEVKTMSQCIDVTPGGLVWVCRRNGSWWPGRILGEDELPKRRSRLASPRSGTPVKLLGRDNGSMEWYNLEKSKRIKAFRCGEYDECIEKAKATATGSYKKAVKYARREQAILQALEIESARNSEDGPDTCSTMGKPSKDGIQESPTTIVADEGTDPMVEEISSFGGNSNSGQELSHSGVSFEDPNHIGASKERSAKGRRKKPPNDSEDDAPQGTKRMRGLEDLGMGAASSFTKKRSQLANVHELLKKKNRCRQLTKVMESTVMVTMPVMCETLASATDSSILGVFDSNVSGLESSESKRNLSTVVNNNSDSSGENGTSLTASEHASNTLLTNCKEKENDISSMSDFAERDTSNMLCDVPLLGADKHLTDLSSPSRKPQLCALAQSSQSSQVEAVSVGIEELNESGSTSSGAADTKVINNRIEKGSSKWKLKGKRNLRNTSKHRKQGMVKPVDLVDESSEYFASLQHGDVGTSLNSDCFARHDKSRPVSETQVDELQGRPKNAPHKEPQRLLPFRLSRVTINPKYQSSEFPHKVCGPDSYLYDVNVEVKASSRPQHVPYISLMSKLNGRPITGHPITVEALEDGFCDRLIGVSGHYKSSSYLEGDEGAYGLEGGLDAVYVGKQYRNGGRIPSEQVAFKPRISPCKSSKSRKSGLLSKKIRKLSSLTGSRKRSDEYKKPAVNKLKGPAIDCVPLKLVFSRINAALNGSMRPVSNV